MGRRRKGHYSGIGGQAVLEGVMMKNKSRCAVAVRRPNDEIVVEIENYQGILKEDSVLRKIPFIRGIFNFIESLILGNKALNASASYYDEEEENTKAYKALDKVSGGNAEKIINGIVMLIAVALAIGIFVVLPYFVSDIFRKYLQNESLIMIIEGGLRILIFILYILLISLMKDIRRLFRYHGAEHKCINCIERGRPLTVSNVIRSSRLHKRCGTSFVFFVFFVSVILFFFIHVDNVALKVLYRILLMPVIAGVSYELIRIAGRTDNIFVNILSAPGLWIQKLTTKEPDRSMIEVAIASVEAVFDWKEYLKTEFGYDVDPKDLEEVMERRAKVHVILEDKIELEEEQKKATAAEKSEKDDKKANSEEEIPENAKNEDTLKGAEPVEEISEEEPAAQDLQAAANPEDVFEETIELEDEDDETDASEEADAGEAGES